MGRFLLAVREMWYFGGGKDIDIGEGVDWGDDVVRGVAVVRDVVGALFRADSVLGCDVGEAGGKTSSAFFGAVGFEVRFEGSSGFGSGGCALSDSVTASAAARSAARAASWGVVGAAGGACEGAVGVEGFAMV
jgi:hypothetical protein